MNDFEFKALFYDKPSGDKPAKHFLEKLEPKMRAKMLRLIDMLERNFAVLIPRIWMTEYLNVGQRSARTLLVYYIFSSWNIK